MQAVAMKLTLNSSKKIILSWHSLKEFREKLAVTIPVTIENIVFISYKR